MHDSICNILNSLVRGFVGIFSIFFRISMWTEKLYPVCIGISPQKQPLCSQNNLENFGSNEVYPFCDGRILWSRSKMAWKTSKKEGKRKEEKREKRKKEKKRGEVFQNFDSLHTAWFIAASREREARRDAAICAKSFTIELQTSCANTGYLPWSPWRFSLALRRFSEPGSGHRRRKNQPRWHCSKLTNYSRFEISISVKNKTVVQWFFYFATKNKMILRICILVWRKNKYSRKHQINRSWNSYE